ncbi:hypothetical protein BGZ96_006695, partial [Linnemannia gamsii]
GLDSFQHQSCYGFLAMFPEQRSDVDPKRIHDDHHLAAFADSNRQGSSRRCKGEPRLRSQDDCSSSRFRCP